MRAAHSSLACAAAVSVLVMLWAPPMAAAQAPAPAPPAGSQTQTSFLGTPAFAQLTDGKSIVVHTSDGRDFEGVFSISEHALVMARFITIPFEQVARVQKSTFRIRLHSLIGLGVGAAVGGLTLLANCNGDCGDGPGLAAAFVGAGGGIGAGIGAGVGGILNAVNADKDVIYDANRRATTVAVAPILSPARRGVAVTVTWR
jgi:hypothetical protein